jgi:hypothetical protein
MKLQTSNRILRIVIVILALADGVLHLLLDFVLFGGRNGPPAGSRPAPPPGSPPPGPRFALPIPLNVLFLLNFIGAVVLVLLFWFGPRWLGRKHWWVDVIMIVYAAATFVAWVMFGQPNPMGLGYLSKGLEIALIIALLVDIWMIRKQSSSSGEAPPKTP